mmetsp:Transcript_30320/g.46432  ORF Transcript_30320/g.46432 Transcript_30320/m.46432 type:complete len:107 (-) Transcript_30320:611-931(-)
MSSTRSLCWMIMMMMMIGVCSGFAPMQQQPKSSSLQMATGDSDFMRAARSARSAGFNDRLVELKRPLGLVLNQDESGNVYVETVAPRGNAARTGKVSVVVGVVVVL